MKELVLFLLLIFEEIGSLSIPTDTHLYCKKDACPRYRIIQKFQNLELRCYEPSIWIGISGHGKLFVENHNLPIWKLKRFINGNNTKGVQVPIGTITGRLFDESRSMVTAEYYVPNYFWNQMPREIDPSVRVLFRQEFCVYVYGFHGFLHSYETLTSYRTHVKHLINQLGVADDYYHDFFFYINYHSGFLFFPDYNEIWYVNKFENSKKEKNTST